MGEAVTYGIELAVGVASFAAGVVAWRSRGPRWLAVVLVVAGIAAAVHAIAELAS